MLETLPMVATGRSLIPGHVMSLLAPEPAVAVGDRVVVLRTDPETGPARVGTEALALERSRGSGALLRVGGRRLVDVDSTDGETARVAPVPPGAANTEVRTRARRSLSRYLAVRAEAGLGGSVHFELSDDQDTASHQVASALRVTWPELQEILEAGDATARLVQATHVLDRETLLLGATMRGPG